MSTFIRGGILVFLLCLICQTWAQEDFNATLNADLDINRAKLLAKYSSIAYCSELSVMFWNCLTCRDRDLDSFRPVKFIRGSFDTQGYIGYDDSVKTIYIVFQGSASIQNWFANLQVFKLDYDYPGLLSAKVHSGFYLTSQSLYEDLYSTLKTLLSTKPGYNLVITGHSQGAANAMMVALMIRDELGVIPEVQTFGEPRVGNQVYSNYWKSRVQGIAWRFTHQRDPVPQSPPTWLGFHHRATEVWLQNGQGTDYKICNSSGEDPTCQNSVAFPIDILDHLFYFNIYLGVPCI